MLNYTINLDNGGGEKLKNLSFDGLKNARDLSQSNIIKENKLIRSEDLSKLSNDDLDKLKNQYNVKAVIDLRMKKEKKLKDRLFPSVKYIEVPFKNYKELKSNPDKKARKHKNGIFPNLCEYYRLLVAKDKKDNWTKIFDVIYNNRDGAVLWHCQQGKDRTGIVAAIIEYALGLSDEEVMNDYLFTNTSLATPLKYKLISFVFVFKKLRREFMELFTARREYLLATLDYIKENYGGIDGFLRDMCGIDKEKKEELRRIYLK